MAFESETTKEAKQEIKKGNKMNFKQYKEITKTILLTAFVTGTIAFIAGVQYQLIQAQNIKAEAATIVKNVKVEVSK